MGKAPTITWKSKFRVLKDLSIFNDDGSLRKKTYYVWEEAHKKLKGLTKKTIQLDVHHNRNNIKEELLRYKGLWNGTIEDKTGKDVEKELVDGKELAGEDADERHDNQVAKLKAMTNAQMISPTKSQNKTLSDKDLLEGTECDDEADDFALRDPNPRKFPTMKFTIHLNGAEWREIKPAKGATALPKYRWTSVIASVIYESTSLRCAYSFRVGKPFKTMPEKYIDFYGYCTQSDCRTYIYGIAKKKPKDDDEGITFDISTYDTTKLLHKTKRHLIGIRRKKVAEKLVHMKAEQLRHQMVHNMMSFSEDQERPDIPSGANLRCVKSEGLREYLGITGPKDPIKNLIFLMDNFDFIKQVYLKPFRVWYWFDNQVKLWDSLAPINPVLKLDATGSLVKKVEINEESSAYIYLYQLITTVGNNYAPLCQMVSSKHDNDVINEWLNTWKDAITYLPKEVVCDDGLALLYALCETFNDCKWKEYLTTCLGILLGQKNLPRLKCKIGLDRAHITKSPSTWKCVKDKNDKTFNDFITRSVALACICETLEGVRQIFLATFVICLSETNENGSVCEEKFEWFLKECENFGIDCAKKDDAKGQVDNNFVDWDNSKEEKDFTMSSNAVKDYIMAIYNEAIDLVNRNKVVVTVTNKNSFYCPDIISNLVFLYCLFPAWTMVMLLYFCSNNKVATSAEIEAYFKDLKNTHGLKSGMAANTFIMYHGRIIDAQIKIAKCRLMGILNEEKSEVIGESISKLELEISSVFCDVEKLTDTLVKEGIPEYKQKTEAQAETEATSELNSTLKSNLIAQSKEIKPNKVKSEPIALVAVNNAISEKKK